MQGFVYAAAGAGAGCCAMRIAKKKRLKSYLEGNGALSQIGTDFRRAWLVGNGIVRAQMYHAFLATSKQHAPVPLTSLKAYMGSYVPILSTAVGGYAFLVNLARVPVATYNSFKMDASAVRMMSVNFVFNLCVISCPFFCWLARI